MPSRIGGEPPRVTNASEDFRRKSQVLKLWDDLAQLTQAHKGLNSQPNTRIWLENQISQREGWGVFLWLWDLFLEVHRPLRNDHVSVEELVREFSHNNLGLFQLLSSFPLR
jgi:hypothetical protein